jgi:hypothetical protein
MTPGTRALISIAVGAATMAADVRAVGQPPVAAATPVVVAVGCAAESAQHHIWELSHASAVVTSSVLGITTKERAELGGRSLGENTYRLIGVADFVDAESSKKIGVRGEILPRPRVNTTAMLAGGHKVAVKGLYINAAPATINLTSVVDLGRGCP